MEYTWIEEFCLDMPAVEKEYKSAWNAIIYKIGGKMFVMLGNNKEGEDIVSVKLKPEYGIAMREQYVEISPGYYLNKVHWNSIKLSGNVPNDAIKAMLEQSYRIVFSSLTKKKQNEINIK